MGSSSHEPLACEAILTNSLPNPPRREQYAPSRHRLREIFYGLRETRMILPPNSVYGGVDGCNLLTALNFFQNTLVAGCLGGNG